MGTFPVRQTAFTTGEVDIVTWKRTDNAQAYMSAAQFMTNMETGTTALAKKRRGTKSLYKVIDSPDPNSQIYEFRDNNGQYYIMMSRNLGFEIYRIDSTTTNPELFHYATVVTPYVSADLSFLDYTLDNDSLVLTHQTYPVARVYVASYGPVVFGYQVLQISPLPAYDFGDVAYNSATVTAIGVPTGAVGTSITLRFNVDFGGLAAAQAWLGGQILAAGTSATSPLGYYIISSVTQAGGAGTIDFTGIVRVAIGLPLSINGDQYSVRKPAFLAGPDTFNRGYPEAVMFYQNRLWFGATPLLPTTIFGSQINQPVNFDVGVGLDSEAIIYAIGQNDCGKILWLNGGKQLEVYTQNFEFVCPQDVNSGLTPSNFSIRQQTSYGSSETLKPTSYINDSYYVNKTGNSIINFKFDGVGLAYSARNISAVSQHLVKNPIDRALQRGTVNSQDNFLYFLNSDNTITSFQFVSEQGLAALTPMVLQHDDSGNPTVLIKSICTVNNIIYMLKYFVLTGFYFLERFDETFKVDSYDTYFMAIDGTVAGLLSNFEGYTVQVIFQGQDFGEYVVTGGQITVFNPNNYSGVVQIGLLYDVRLTPMYLFAGEDKAYHFKNVSKIYVDYYNSLDFTVDGTLVPFQNFQDIQAGLPLTPQTDTAIIYPVNGYDRFQTFDIIQNAPFDLQILAIGYQITASII